MRISEVAELTGLSVSNIRFYEKKGLLEPARDQQSKYREYSDEDIYRLKQILLFRKMGISIETICLLLEHKVGMEETIDQQMVILREKQQALQGAIDLCAEMRANVQSDKFDIDYYLNYVKGEESNGRKFAEMEELLIGYSSYTKFELLASDPLVGRFLRGSKVIRTARLVWSALILMVPLALMILDYLDDGKITVIKLIYCLLVAVALWSPFIHFYRVHSHKKE